MVLQTNRWKWCEKKKINEHNLFVLIIYLFLIPQNPACSNNSRPHFWDEDKSLRKREKKSKPVSYKEGNQRI